MFALLHRPFCLSVRFFGWLGSLIMVCWSGEAGIIATAEEEAKWPVIVPSFRNALFAQINYFRMVAQDTSLYSFSPMKKVL